tara:strand:+ start:3754 stop:4098 length:345 start_codon:yes stop_codon:yes gene_type:complete
MDIVRINSVGGKLDVSAALSDPWMVATGCSWRRILTQSGRSVCVPDNHHQDNHPDLLADHGVLQLMATSPQLYESTVLLIETLERVLAGRSVKNVDEVLSFAEKSLAGAAKKVC